MRRRCYDQNNQDYHRYGGRGITVCPEWLGYDGFTNFLKDMGLPPDGMSIGRKDNDAGYCTENCRWETAVQQGRNTSRNVFYEFGGRRLCISAWAEERKISAKDMRYRLKTMPIDKALSI